MPIAVPWCSGGYQREASGSATANEAPATPSITPSASAWAKLCTPSHQAVASEAITSACASRPVRRAPMRSASRPRNRRRTAPHRIGTATISARCWVSSPSTPAICTCIGPSRYQTMKLRSK
jgi:hypothetical protein